MEGEKGFFWEKLKKGLCKRKTFGLRKRRPFFDSYQDRLKKSFFSDTVVTISHCNKSNVQLQISSAKSYCELAAKQPFFETSQSCVSTTVSLSHRFKSSPSIPGKIAAFRTAGYLMMAGHLHKNYVSSGDLNRPRSPEVRKPLGYFWFFSYKRKERKNVPSQEVPRFSKPRISAQRNNLVQTKLNPFEKFRGFPNLKSAHQNNDFAQKYTIACPCVTVLLHFSKSLAKIKTLC